MACFLHRGAETKTTWEEGLSDRIRDRPAGNEMTDKKLQTMSENQLRALYSSAPEYLKTLLGRKRVMDQGIVWELSIPERAARRTG